MGTDERSQHLLSCALWYAKKGWPVLPLHSIQNGACTCKKKGNCPTPGKHPRYDTEHLKEGVKSATTQKWIIEKWWTKWPHSNIGIATGHRSFDVIDIDRRENKDGVESLHDIEAALGIKIPDTVEQITGGGGYQRMFKYADGALQNAVGFAPGLDIRTDGGLVVVPPSIHISGNKYEWEPSSEPWRVELAEFPTELLDYILNQSMRHGSNGDGVNVASILDGVKQGARDQTLFRYACRLRNKLSYDEAKIIILNIASKCTPEFPSDLAIKVLNQAWKYTASQSNDFDASDVTAVTDVAYVTNPRNALLSSPPVTCRVTSDVTSISPEHDPDSYDDSIQPTENQTQKVRDWVESCDGIFTIQDMARELQITSTKSYKTLKVILGRLVKKQTIERTTDRRGVYRKVEKEPDELCWWNEQKEEEFDIEFPLEIHELCRILPKNIIVIAGERNSSKTCLCLNIAKLNMNRHNIRYLTSEMGPAELRERLRGFEGMSLAEWRKIKFYDRCSNFHDFVDPNGLNIIDYLEIHDEFWRVGGIIRKIYDRLETGVAIVCLQKRPGSDTGKGGEVTLEKARLALSVSTMTDVNGRIYNQCKIVKAKAPRDIFNHPQNMVIEFNVIGGWKIRERSEWKHDTTVKQAASQGRRF